MGSHGTLHRLYQWLFVIGIAVLFAPPLLSLSTRSAVRRNQEWAETMNWTLDSLAAIRDTTTAPARVAWLDDAMEVTRTGLARAEQQLANARDLSDSMWRWNGRGPLLLVTGGIFVFIAIRLRRFERYGV
jgi:hypothetical protein